jgi:hypothetical protein
MKRVKKKAKAKPKSKSKAKPRVKRASRASGARKGPANAKKPPNAGAKGEGAKGEGSKVQVSLKADVTGKSAPELIDQRILDVAGWRADALARMRALIREAHPEVVEEWKWEVPVWSHDGIVCTGEVYQNVVKLTFAHGAAVPDPSNLFNSSLQGNTRRAIDIHEGDRVDGEAFKALFKAAAARNSAAKRS